MEYRVDNKYYKLGVLTMRIPEVRKNLNCNYFLGKVFGKVGGSLSPIIAFRNLEKLFNDEALLKEVKNLKQEFTEEELKLFIKFGTNIGNPKYHVSEENEEMFLRGILARK